MMMIKVLFPQNSKNYLALDIFFFKTEMVMWLTPPALRNPTKDIVL